MDISRRALLGGGCPTVAVTAVPGMPPGSPGMETPGRPPEDHRVLTFDRSGGPASSRAADAMADRGSGQASNSASSPLTFAGPSVTFPVSAS
jgi:hypothetical protein